MFHTNQHYCMLMRSVIRLGSGFCRQGNTHPPLNRQFAANAPIGGNRRLKPCAHAFCTLLVDVKSGFTRSERSGFARP